jgi:putative two-component system hydrogenase maturation factor HypX/HoxX
MHHRLADDCRRRASLQALIDACLAGDPDAFRVDVARRAAELAMPLPTSTSGCGPSGRGGWPTKRRSRWRAIVRRNSPRLQRNFYGFDPSYHVARFHFVHKTPNSWTPRHLAIHRDLGWSVPQ